MIYSLTFFETVSEFLASIWDGISMIIQLIGNFAMTLLSLLQVLSSVIEAAPLLLTIFPPLITAVAAVVIAMGIVRLIWW